MAQQNINTNNALKEGEVRPKEDVTVYGTDKSKFLETGEPVTVHKAIAEKLVKAGMATMEAPKTSKKEEGK